MKSGIIIALIISVLFCFSEAFAQDSIPLKTESQVRKKLVYKFNIKENIAPAIWRQTKQAFEAADSLKADLFLIHMNTYGGTVVDADSIRTRILNSKIPVVVFIDNNAASAGALISIACDRIYMRSGGSIGAATVVNQTGEKMPDKYQSYMRSTMRATAEAHGRDTIIAGKDTTYRWKRDPLIAEAMVDDRIFIKGIIDTGKVLTFTPMEAMKNGFCEGICENVDEVLKLNEMENARIVEYKPTRLERFIGFMVNPIVSGILIMAILGGIYFEMQTPGIGFPFGVAVLAAILYFSPLYLEGLAANWEILIFVIGLILIALEIFVVPGFGVTGISGIALAFSGLVLSLIKNVDFTFEHVNMGDLLTAVGTVFIGSIAGIGLAIYLSQKLFTTEKGQFSHLSLKEVMSLKDGYVGVDPALMFLKGKKGIAVTTLRPSGKISIEGKNYDALAESGMIDKGTRIVVTRVETAQLYVEEE
ncbi:MAG: NfeD family protein [Bacteroidota bacterium]|nr:serine protease [Odoribacter sp.]MDP3644096.1 NfeD family protein [Bacteroidota bacterium]